jgi:transcriptional regulator with XRE-family HTH domain
MTSRERLDDLAIIGRLAKARRLDLGLHQADVAERAHMNRAYINRFEKGLIASPKIMDLRAVAEALEWPLERLLPGLLNPGNDPILELIDRFAPDSESARRARSYYRPLGSASKAAVGRHLVRQMALLEQTRDVTANQPDE